MAPKTVKIAMKAVKKAATKAAAKPVTKASTKARPKPCPVKTSVDKSAARSGSVGGCGQVCGDSWEDRLGGGWARAMERTLAEPAFLETLTGVALERTVKNTTVYPPEADVFRAFAMTPLAKVRVVIVGQDPYHGPEQAMGLSFSVPRDKKIPPSLRNMFKELAANEGKDAKVVGRHGDLTSWAQQGVLLLNSVLTVRDGEPNSHCKLGWQLFTDAALQAVSDNSEFTVFLLWGKFAEQKASFIDNTKHYVLVSGHPSPLSFRHFQGCDHFRKTNTLLLKHGRGPAIVWDQSEE